MHALMQLAVYAVHIVSQPVPAPAGPDLTEIKAVLGRLAILIATGAVLSLGALIAYLGWQHMTGGEEGAMKAKHGAKRLIIGFGVVIFSGLIASTALWLFGDAIAKGLKGA